MTVYQQPIVRAAGMAAAFMAALAVNLALPRTATAQEVSEIVVTARRAGEEKLKEVPLAITAFSSDAIEAANIQTLGDVAALTPGLSFFNAFGENLPVPVIRGIVPQDIFGQNAAAVFVDGVFISGRSGLNFSQLDIERIEVIKGPQSAQYGQNAFSGAINYVTKAPSDIFEVKSELEGGTYDKQRAMAEVSGPLIGEALTGRISGLYDYWDGSYDNTLAPDTHIGGFRHRSLQGKLRWRPASTLDVNGGLYYSNDDIDEAPVAGLPANCQDKVDQEDADRDNNPDTRYLTWCGKIPDLASLPGRLDPVTLQPIPGSTNSHGMSKDALAGGEHREVTRGSLNAQWSPDLGTISSLTGYTYTKHSSASDFERSAGDSIPFLYCTQANTTGAPPLCESHSAQFPGVPQFNVVPMGFVDFEPGDTTQEISQELRFTSPRDQRLRYAGGGYYYHVDEFHYRGALVATTPFPQPYNVPGTDVNAPGPVVSEQLPLDIGAYIFGQSLTADGAMDPLNRPASQTKTESWSAFGSVDFDLTEKWTLNGEIRFTEDHQTGYAYQYKRCAASDVAEFPAHQVNYFPFNSPPTDLCGDDYFDLRPGQDGALGSCLGDTNPLTHVPLQDGSCTPGNVNGSLRSSYYTGRVGLKYQVNPDWMAYTSVAWGEKPGGLQLVTANVVYPDGSLAPESLVHSFDPEKITAYELGVKGFTSSHRVGLDLAVYYNDWTAIVLRQLVEKSPLSGLPYQNLQGFNINSGDASVWGWESTIDIAITDNLSSRVTGAWTDSHLKNARQDTFALMPAFYTSDPSCTPAAIQAIPDPTPEDPSNNVNEAQDHKAAQCQKESGNVSGNTQMRQPEWTASASLSYNRQINNDWKWYARAQGSYEGKVFVGNDNLSWLPQQINVNMTTGVSSSRYTLEFWVKNLLNNDSPTAAFRDIYWTNNSDIQNTQATTPTAAKANSNFDDFPPLRMSITYPDLRTFGLTAKIRFGGAEK